MFTDRHFTTIQVDGQMFALYLRNDEKTYQIVIYRADAIELFDVEDVITTQGYYATQEYVRNHIRNLVTFQGVNA